MPPQGKDPSKPVDPNGGGFGPPGKPPALGSFPGGSFPGSGAGLAPAQVANGPVVPDDQRGPTALPPGSFVTPVFEGGSLGEPIPFETVIAQDKARIAQLEKLVAELRAGKPAMVGDPWGFNTNDYGNWDPKDLVDVLKKVMADDVKAKKYAGAIVFSPEKDHFTVTGSPEALSAVTEWVKKLKK